MESGENVSSVCGKFNLYVNVSGCTSIISQGPSNLSMNLANLPSPGFSLNSQHLFDMDNITLSLTLYIISGLCFPFAKYACEIFANIKLSLVSATFF